MVDVIHNDDNFELDFEYDNYVWKIEEEMEKITDSESFKTVINNCLEEIDKLIDITFDDNDDDIFSDWEVLKDLSD